MEFDFGLAVLAGLIGTAVMTVLMYMAPLMGMRPMDMPMMLGAMVMPPSGATRIVGLVMHFMAGVVFFLVYAWVFELIDVSSGALVSWAGVFGLVHGVMAGAMMGMMPAMHPRMATAGVGAGPGMVEAPGPFAFNMGSMAPVAIVVLHIVFGVVAGAVYAA